MASSEIAWDPIWWCHVWWFHKVIVISFFLFIYKLTQETRRLLLIQHCLCVPVNLVYTLYIIQDISIRNILNKQNVLITHKLSWWRVLTKSVILCEDEKSIFNNMESFIRPKWRSGLVDYIHVWLSPHKWLF